MSIQNLIKVQIPSWDLSTFIGTVFVSTGVNRTPWRGIGRFYGFRDLIGKSYSWKVDNDKICEIYVYLVASFLSCVTLRW